MILSKGHTYHVLHDDEDDQTICGCEGKTLSLQELKSLVTEQRQAVCAMCYEAALDIFTLQTPPEYIAYCRSLPCGDWTQKQIEGLWNAAIDAAIEVANPDGCVHSMDYVMSDLRDLKIQGD